MVLNNTLIRLLKIEVNKAIKNKVFVTILIIATIFAIFSAWYMIDSYFYAQQMSKVMGKNSNPMTQAFSLFTYWIGGESASLGYTLFFTFMPLLAVLPYGWSYFVENKTGYVTTVVTRGSKRHYFFSKYIATFTAGGLVILIPLIINFLIVASFVPAVTPTKIYPLYYAVVHGSLWSELFYTYPLVYVALYLFLNFIFAGLFATMGLAISFFIKNRIAILLLPFFSFSFCIIAGYFWLTVNIIMKSHRYIICMLPTSKIQPFGGLF